MFLKKAHAYFQTILKVPVKFLKDWLNSVGEVTRTWYIHLIHFYGIRPRKKSK